MYYYRYLQQCPLGSFAYTIRPGDTLYVIARNNGTTVEAIMAINPGINPNNLQIGQIICVPTMAPPIPPCTGGFYYTIRAGDSLYRISQQFNVTIDALIRANPGINPNNLQIGQVICIPTAAPPTPSCPGGFLYTIKAGDTLYNLALQYNVTVQEIIAANPGIDPNRLQIGQVICIPRTQVPPCPGGFYYTIRSGDTLYTIAQRYNVPLQELIAANPGINPNRLQIGQVICIPRRA